MQLPPPQRPQPVGRDLDAGQVELRVARLIGPGRSADTEMSLPSTTSCGVWAKPAKRMSVSWPGAMRSIRWGGMWASSARASSCGTMSMMRAPAWITLPGVCTASPTTVPSTGARSSVAVQFVGSGAELLAVGRQLALDVGHLRVDLLAVFPAVAAAS